MQSVNFLHKTMLRFSLPVSFYSMALIFGIGTSVAVPLAAQTATPAAEKNIPVLATPSAPRWNELSLAQQDALMPLQGTWNTLDITRKRKWIAVARNFPALPPPEQVKIHSRMAEWAALNPHDREQARFNFFETKKLALPDKASTWEAYKALSPDEKQRLATQASAKPTGAAAAVKPGNPEKLTAVPVTRRSPTQVRDLVFSKQSIDRNTLLPLAVSPVIDPPSPQN
jgi:hypothetical protein